VARNKNGKRMHLYKNIGQMGKNLRKPIIGYLSGSSCWPLAPGYWLFVTGSLPAARSKQPVAKTLCLEHNV
jgi:hypothetical protein